jgi:hypothetical protein
MIQCPNCRATLPDWQKTCQFCQSDTASVIRPNAPGSQRNPNAFSAPKWVWGAYYGLSVYWILDGAFDAGKGILQISQANAAATAAKDDVTRMMAQPSFVSYFMILIGTLSALFGIGLLLRNETVRGIVNFFAGLRIIFGLFGLLGSLIGTLFAGPWGLFFMLLNIITIASAAMMIYLIGETDKYSY